MDNVDDIRAHVERVCKEHDKFMAECEWQAKRRRKETPMVRKSAPGVLYRDVAPAENRADENALQCTPPVTSPAPSTNEEYYAGWERWLQGHIEIERGHLIAVLGEEFAATRNELLDRIEPQAGKIAALELKLAELTGAVDVLRGKEPPPPAKFPRVKAWKEDTVYYEGDIVAFAGGTFQARRDTACLPGAKHWVCLAKPGNSLTVRGTYDSCIDYRCLDIAVINGSSFVALKDSPGACPGDDWQLLCSRGSRGHRGERGFIGPRGERAIPVVFVVAEDPVRVGLVASLAQPGGNLTGINFLSGELVAKRLELLRELVPGTARLAVLVNPVNAINTETTLRDVKAAARAIGLQIQVLNASTSGEINTAFASLERERPDALFVGGDAFFNTRRVHLVNLASHHSLPAAYAERVFPEIGGLMSYGTDIVDAYRQVGSYAGRILKGAKAADLPVVQATKFELVINAESARMVGLTVPPSLLALADEVIE